jgi:hypothetical protein
MKLIKSIQLIFFLAALPFLVAACDDSGTSGDKTKSNFTPTNLPPLGAEDGVQYELFVSFDTSADHENSNYFSLGKFNVNINGQPVNSAGSVTTFGFKFTPDFSKAKDAIVTMEPIVDNDTLPNGPRVMGGAGFLQNGVLTFHLNMNYVDVLDSIPARLGDSVRYILATPTDSIPVSEYYRGIWLTTDSLGQSSGMNSPFIPESMEWTYHAWLLDVTNPGYPAYYNIGRFTNPGGADDYNSCQGNSPGYNKPGHDFISTNAGCQNTANLNLGNFRLLVTLEPRNWLVQSKPAPFRIFYGTVSVAGFAIPSNIPNVSNNYLPTGLLQITTN